MTQIRANVLLLVGAGGFLVLLVLGALAVGGISTPSFQASEDVIAAYFADRAEGHLRNMYLATLGGFLFYPLFLAGLVSRMRDTGKREEPYALAALVGGILFLGPLLVQAVAWGTGGFVAEESHPSAVRSLFALGNLAFTLSTYPIALIMGAASLVGLRTGLLPHGLSLVGLLAAGLLAVAGVLVAGLVVNFAFALFGLWMLAVGVFLRRPSVHPDS